MNSTSLAITSKSCVAVSRKPTTLLFAGLLAFGLALAALAIPEATSEEAANPGSLVRNGQKAPPFEVTTIDGRRLTAKTLRGRPVLVLFFTTHCAACRAELVYFETRLDALAEGAREATGTTTDAATKNLVAIAVGRDNSASELRAFWRAQGLSDRFAVVADPDRELYKRFATVRVPRTYLIDDTGRVVHQTRDFSPEQCDQVLEQAAVKRSSR